VTAQHSPAGRATDGAVDHPQVNVPQRTDADLWHAMILVENLHQFGSAWCGALLRMNREDALAALEPMRPGDLTDPRLTIVARAVWHAAQAGSDPEPLAVAQAAYWHGLVPEDTHHVFLAFLVDLSQCTPPGPTALDAATTPAHIARTLREVAR
jgi:hypothetical protein